MPSRWPAAVFLMLVVSCYRGDQLIRSESGAYMAFLTVHRCEDGLDIWVVNIRGCEDSVELMEFMNDYPAYQMAYIGWDGGDRLWFYSSDDGSYFYWERTEGIWEMCSWSLLESSELYPPSSITERNEGERR